MEKSKRKNKSITIILSILYFCTILTLSYFSFYYIQEIKNTKQNIKKNEEVLASLNNELLNYEDNDAELIAQIDNLTNIDKNISDLKNEVFKSASELEKKIRNGETNVKIAYLTFDDGPYYLTDSFLKVLDEYEVKATFFTIGADKDKCFDNRSKDCSSTYKKIVDKGHTIANHTYSHAIFYGLYSSTTSFMNQVQKQEKLIKDRTGVTTNIIRFPGGSATAGGLKQSIIKKLRENGYGWVDWSAQNGDGGYVATKANAWSNFTSTINGKIEVVLFHDYNYTTLSMLPDAIEYLQKNNYILLPLFYDSVMVNK